MFSWNGSTFQSSSLRMTFTWSKRCFVEKSFLQTVQYKIYIQSNFWQCINSLDSIVIVRHVSVKGCHNRFHSIESWFHGDYSFVPYAEESEEAFRLSNFFPSPLGKVEPESGSQDINPQIITRQVQQKGRTKDWIKAVLKQYARGAIKSRRL